MNISKFINQDQRGRRNPSLVLAMFVRLFLLITVLLMLFGHSEYQVDLSGISLFMAMTFAMALLYALWLRNDEHVSRQALYQFMVDTVIITGLVHFTGGVNSGLSLLYPLVILAAGIIVAGQLAVRVAVLSACLYLTLIVLEAGGTLPYRGVPPSPYENLWQVSQQAMLQVLLFAFFAGISSYVGDRYIYQSRQLRRLRDMTKSALSSVSVPLLAVQKPEGRIRLANPAACQVLQKDEEALEGALFDDIFWEQPSSPGENNFGQHRLWWIKREDGTTFPASLEISNNSLSGAILNAFHHDTEEAEINLVAFQDMSRIMAEEEDIRNHEKAHTAVGMITEMAHLVRNPLTAIRGAGELINAAVEAALSHQHQITEEEFVTLKSMCEIIFEQTQELNTKVEDFMTYASGDQEKLLDLINKANLWGDRVIKTRGKQNSGKEENNPHS